MGGAADTAAPAQDDIVDAGRERRDALRAVRLFATAGGEMP